ncbi:hypothetical protein nbrc107696_19950 [Gordonia spumicola]|uniref:Lipoprotein n=1 Tax=Gordonia spumicola TaxID=589161 RepID=A0A7I9V8D5_9ACTN|nr:hypothetical protein [Gordonia spumicola]GEE01549.1 hypothetical protein nbrc107696_19950 [Gordonia spumicola]
MRRVVAVLFLLAMTSVAACGSGDDETGSTTAPLGTLQNRSQASEVDPSPYQRTGDLYVFAAGSQITCGIGRASDGQMGNLTCHLPPGAPYNGALAVDIDANGVKAAVWPRWSGAPQLAVGSAITVGTGRCEVTAPDTVRCSNHGGWVQTSPAGTTASG